jgi:putative transcriptional regulator
MTRVRLKPDGAVVEIRPDGTESPIEAGVNWSRVDATTEEGIETQITEDEAEAIRDAAAYSRSVRERVGLSQTAFARRIGVPVATVRNWEQGKRSPRGPARALLRLLHLRPELAREMEAPYVPPASR